MRTAIRLFAALAAAVFALSFVSAVPGETAYPPRTDCIRLHIVANSDETADQQVKLAVRDALLAVARTRFSAASREEAEPQLLTLAPALQYEAERTLATNGMDYGVQLMTGEFDFPDRVYGGELYPAGRYEALKVVLGEGAGHNWWCVMFPPLCVIETENSPAEYEEDGTLKFKSFFADLWKELFG